MNTNRNSTWPSFTRLVFAVCLAAIGRIGLAAEPADAAKCAAIPGERERLECYDAAAGRGKVKPAEEQLQQLSTVPTPKAPPGAAAPTPLSVRWELDPETKQGPWVLRPHQPLFILAVVHTDTSHDSPQSPAHPQPFSAPLQDNEAEFQLSFKFKAAENLFSLFGSQADLWLAYTQQSQWQIYNHEHSAPFRETNYMPEMFLLFPTRYDLLGLTGRFVSLGLVHQSNGRADPLSRSWNRVYTQLGFERGHFALLVRPWARIQDGVEDDDNPDIMRYMGYGDVTGIYQWGRQEFSVTARYNAGYASSTDTWSFPIQGRLKGYVKITTGYGETLIDYNWKQNTIGAGILLVDWL
jgi:phospholipase A1